MWVEFFVLWGLWFWMLTVPIGILLLWLVSDDKVVKSLLVLILYFVVLHVFGNVNVFKAAQTHPEYIYIGLPVYLMVGVLWSVIKWWLFAKDLFQSYKELRQSFLRENGYKTADLNDPIPDSLAKKWVKLNPNHYWYNTNLRVALHKNKICSWMCLWPVSMLCEVLDNPWKLLYNLVSSTLQKIADNLYKDSGIEEDLRLSDKDGAGPGGV